MAAFSLTNEDIRTYLMDRKELNPLLKGIRWTDAEINAACARFVDYANETPPYSMSFSPTSIPRYTLLVAAAGQLLRSASIQQASNEFQYSASDVTIQDNSKSEIFMRIGQQLWEEAKERINLIKMAQNISNCYGTTYSELIYVAR